MGKLNKNIKVLSKSFLCAFLSLATLTGCFKDGKDGEDGTAGTNGAIWYYGDGNPTSSIGAVGDFYFETDDGDVWLKGDDGWNVVSNLIGSQGVPGGQGSAALEVEYRNNGTHIQWKYKTEADTQWKDLVALQDISGQPGKDGNDIYLGYDGYLWSGKDRTHVEFAPLGEDVAENTLELFNNKYFEIDEIDEGTKVILMGNYMTKTKRTQYSNSVIDKLSIYVNAAGKLDLGVFNLETKTYTNKVVVDVVAGSNNLTPNINVGNHETLVIGGSNTTVKFYKSSGVESNDQFGLFSTNDSTLELARTSNICDKVIVNIELTSTFFVEERVFDDVVSSYPNSSISSMTEVSDTHGPYAYKNTTIVSGKVITKIGIPVKNVAALNDQQYVSIHVVSNDTLSNLKPATLKETYKLYLPLDELGSSTTVNKWIYVDCNIPVGENETIAFSQSDDPVNWGYLGTGKNTQEKYRFHTFVFGPNTGSAGNTEGIVFDIYYKDGNTGSFKNHLDLLMAEENK